MYITNAGDVGIGTASPSGRLHAQLPAVAVTATQYTGYMSNLTTNTTTDGISKYGLYATSTGNFPGAGGASTRSYGVYGTASGADIDYGVYGETAADGDVGVAGITPADGGFGVWGRNTFAGAASFPPIGVVGVSIGNITGNEAKFGVLGRASGTGPANMGVRGEATGGSVNYGVSGFAADSDDIDVGVWGIAPPSVGTTNDIGVRGTAQDTAQDWAGFFEGDVRITEDLSVLGQKSFVIDHPLDPENKILRHFAAESPDGMTIYKGRARLVNGSCTVELPSYFDALNSPAGREISLTCIGGWSPLYVDGDIANNSFVVRTTSQGNQNQEFSWVIFAHRNDPAWHKSAEPVEETKGEGNKFPRGEFLCPAAYGGGKADLNPLREMSNLAR